MSKRFSRVRGKIVESNLYLGLAAVGQVDGYQFALLGPDADTVEEMWKRVVPELLLDRARLQEVAIASRGKFVATKKAKRKK